ADAPSVAAFESAASELRVPLSVLRDSFQDGREAYGSKLVLVRPDQFVAWAGDETSDAGTVLRKACGLT
ncbi:MAG TPA: monooxygenase, partial [Dehalococcoidia bacterium]|nr:monooxygenase [Dehalococcoidia bacterium]